MTRRVVLAVWIALLMLTAAEVALAYMRASQQTMLVALVVLSLTKAALIAQYFMHLKYEHSPVYRLIIPVTMAFALLLFGFLPDALRLQEIGK